MTRRTVRAGWMVLLGCVAASAASAESYVGTVAVSGGKPVPVKVTVREYTSDEKAFALAEKLHKDGQDAAAAEMKKADVGTVELEKSSFRAAMIRQEKTAAGRIVRVVTEEPLHVGGHPAAKAPAGTVGYLELTLDAAGAGTGRVLTAVKATFDAEGFVVPDSLGETWAVSGVKSGN